MNISSQGLSLFLFLFTHTRRYLPKNNHNNPALERKKQHKTTYILKFPPTKNLRAIFAVLSL